MGQLTTDSEPDITLHAGAPDSFHCPRFWNLTGLKLDSNLHALTNWIQHQFTLLSHFSRRAILFQFPVLEIVKFCESYIEVFVFLLLVKICKILWLMQKNAWWWGICPGWEDALKMSVTTQTVSWSLQLQGTGNENWLKLARKPPKHWGMGANAMYLILFNVFDTFQTASKAVRLLKSQHYSRASTMLAWQIPQVLKGCLQSYSLISLATRAAAMPTKLAWQNNLNELFSFSGCCFLGSSQVPI